MKKRILTAVMVLGAVISGISAWNGGMVQAEAESRQMDAESRATVWVECLNSSAEKIKALYPNIDIKFKLRFDPEEVKEDEQLETDINRPL